MYFAFFCRIKNNWLIGEGAGDAKDVLMARYSKLILDNPTADNLVDSIVFQIKQKCYGKNMTNNLI